MYTLGLALAGWWIAGTLHDPLRGETHTRTHTHTHTHPCSVTPVLRPSLLLFASTCASGQRQKLHKPASCVCVASLSILKHCLYCRSLKHPIKIPFKVQRHTPLALLSLCRFAPLMLWTRESTCVCLYSFNALVDPVHVSVPQTYKRNPFTQWSHASPHGITPGTEAYKHIVCPVQKCQGCLLLQT